MPDGFVEFEDLECSTDTPKAILVKIDDKLHWIPKSCIHDDSEVYKAGTEGTLIISERIATEKGLT